MNYINYISHILYNPDTFHRRFEFDVAALQDTTKRVLLAALPFIGLCRPLSVPLSIGMGSIRTLSHGQAVFSAEEKGEWFQCGAELGETSLSVLSLVMTFFSFTPGLLLTTGVDAVKGASHLVQSLRQGALSKAGEETLQLLASAAYLSFMITGGLEAILCFVLLQTVISLWQARDEFSKGHFIEGSAKLVMACMRCNQAHHYIELIHRRNEFLAMQKTRDLFLKILRGKQAGHLVHHPLSSLKQRIEENDVILTDGKDGEYHFGSHFHGNGQTLVKGENLTFRTVSIDGKEMIELDFKINHAFRDQLAASIDLLKKTNPREMKEILAMTGSHASAVSIKQGSFFEQRDMHFFFALPGDAHQIVLDGLGTILVGSDASQPNLYDRIVVRLDANQTLYSLHEMLAFLDLDQALRLSTYDDIERLKMGHLFRTFFPREATPFERGAEYFTLPLDQLKKKMIELCPDMEEIFAFYFHRMKAEHLLDGRIRYRIKGLAEAAYEAGARALTAAVTGAYSDKELFDRILSILNMGLLSTELRHENGLQQHGLGGGIVDYYSGGADSVFTQLLTEKNCQEKLSLDEFNYKSKVRLLFSLEALETGTYQYHDDCFGNRIVGKDHWSFGKSYENRENILEFIKNEQKFKRFHASHEIMLKERIPPSLVKGLIVPDEKTKNALLDHLVKYGFVQQGKILNIAIERFIRVGNTVTEDLIS